MVYLTGIFGLVCGFFVGQTVLNQLLRDYSRQEIIEMMKDNNKKLKYGLLNWFFAILGAALFVYIYNHYFHL